MTSLLKYIPKKFHEAVRDAYHDDDGYWVCLKDGWLDGIMSCHVIHTDTIVELREEAKLIKKEYGTYPPGGYEGNGGNNDGYLY